MVCVWVCGYVCVCVWYIGVCVNLEEFIEILEGHIAEGGSLWQGSLHVGLEENSPIEDISWTC